MDRLEEARPFVAEARSIMETSLRAGAVMRGDFVLSSGRKASYYVDVTRVALRYPATRALRVLVNNAANEFGALNKVEAVGGPLTGAIPLVAACDLEGFFIRDSIKAHGTGGRLVGNPGHGLHVMLVDDVISTGDTLHDALTACEGYGLIVEGIYVLVDRDKGAADRFNGLGLEYRAEFTIRDLGVEP